jgi:translation initiation factor 1A
LKRQINSSQQPEELTRIRLPKKSENEILGIAESLLGANKLRVRCMDGVVRLARIPGKMRKRVWIREGDVIIVIPWPFQNEKADVIWKYTGPQVNWLERKGFLKS